MASFSIEEIKKSLKELELDIEDINKKNKKGYTGYFLNLL